MKPIKNIWLNEYENLSHWMKGDIHIIRLEWPILCNGGTSIARRILYKGKNEQKANAIYATEVAK